MNKNQINFSEERANSSALLRTAAKTIFIKRWLLVNLWQNDEWNFVIQDGTSQILVPSIYAKDIINIFNLKNQN